MQQRSDVSKSFICTDEDKDFDSKSLIQPTSSVKVVPDPVQLSSKPIIKRWEEIQSNRNRRGLGYVKDDTKLHIPDYSRPIKFVSAGFLAQITSTSFEKVKNKHKYTQTEVVDKQKYTQTEVAVKPNCLHCQRISHLEDQCFDLHPCHHCGKSNHSSTQCNKQQQSSRLKINYSWIDPWEWSSTVKILYKFYNRIHSHILQPTVK